MLNRTAFLAVLAVLAALPGLAAAGGGACAAPGATVVTDPAGDEGLTPDSGLSAQPAHPSVPLPDPAVDILSLSIATPSGIPGNLVFTYKVSDLSSLQPDTEWAVRFSTDELPANGDDDYFVAMVTDPQSAVSFLYGTTGPAATAPVYGPVPPRMFHPAGALDAASNMKADGTITLVVDSSKIAGITGATELSNILVSTRLITPPDPSLPAFTNPGNSAILDQASTPGIFDLSTCSAVSAQDQPMSALAGAFSPLTLLLLLLPALRRRR